MYVFLCVPTGADILYCVPPLTFLAVFKYFSLELFSIPYYGQITASFSNKAARQRMKLHLRSLRKYPEQEASRSDITSLMQIKLNSCEMA